ncbi:MAG: TRAP transporter small permease subunit [Thermodesulfobacteriota bacterium]|nr:TRAP transporter small permease subunit [Thermodesulfobacteriota bacterium]
MSKVFYVLNRANSYLVRFEKIIVFIVLLLMITVAFGQVVVRNLFSFGFMWADQVMRNSVMWVAFLGAALATNYIRHIRVDVFPRYLTGKERMIAEVIAVVFLMTSCIFFAYAATDYLMVQKKSSLNLLLFGIPDWTLITVIPYFFIVTIFRCILIIRKIVTGQIEETH